MIVFIWENKKKKKKKKLVSYRHHKTVVVELSEALRTLIVLPSGQ